MTLDTLLLPLEQGELLPRLDVTDVRHARLCCKGWRTAIEHQIRRMQPLYLPEAEAPGAAYNSLDSLQLPLIRPVHLGDATTATLQHSITSLAPLHGIAGFSSMWHVSVIDLRGQKLPHRTLQLLSGAIRRLRALTVSNSRLLEYAAPMFAPHSRDSSALMGAWLPSLVSCSTCLVACS